jgi:hypothetical protein
MNGHDHAIVFEIEMLQGRRITDAEAAAILTAAREASKDSENTPTVPAVGNKTC